MQRLKKKTKKKLNNHLTSYVKLINDLLGKMNDLENGYSNLNGEKYFVGDGSQNYVVFQPVFALFKRLLVLIKFLYGNLKGC